MPRRAVKRLVGLASVVVLLGGLVGFAYWWSHPRLFHGVGFDLAYHGTVAVPSGQVAAGIMVPFQDGAGAEITLRTVTPNFAPDSAHAVVTFSICDGETVGLVVSPTIPHCNHVRSVPGAIDLRSTSHQSLLMTVRPTAAGEVRIESISVSYREGSDHLWRQGSETLPITLEFRAR